ncbi:hypothetical protein DEAC_c08510 [Desulfosporosinus acididurans]|uniref:Uncharacterized protein n=1 Tax=Desulfosporosinus acididurans TaxID=476652 RepID=A0A0J1FUB8_9FIRM|nr:hypothetical protein [Desulfosporosinus acididurans]KLU66917.1 hypothetical protein DEAC_c08510 [Desulfosporosinus acididurans]
MRKMNYLIGGLTLGLGVLTGIIGMSLVANSSSAASFINKLRGQENVHTVSVPVADSSQVPQTGNTETDTSVNNSTSDQTSGNSSTPGQSDSSLSANTAAQNGGSQGQAKGTSVPEALKNQIIADYKQDIGTFFDAWKSVDIDTFRLKLAKAYSGEIYEKHARRAEEFLVQGIGLDVTSVNFDRVDVESADDNTATLRVDYRYTARDYNITESVPVGEEHEQNVHVRVNLMKLNSHWLITGESSISN